MKPVYKFIITIATLAIVAFPASSQISLKKINNRPLNYIPNEELRATIVDETKGLSAEEIRIYSIKKTVSMLKFTTENDLPKGIANCVGYAQMCAGIANCAFKENGYKCRATPVVGYVKFCGINFCDVLKWCMPSKRWKNFVKDHDFVEFSIDGTTIYADASIYDLLGVDCKTSL